MPFITDPKNWTFPVLFFLLFLFLVKFLKPVLVDSSIQMGLKEVQLFGKKIFLLAILLLIAIAIGDYTNHQIIKPFWGRLRPCHVLPQVQLLLPCSTSFSFPSSHAVNIFSIATVISWQFRTSAFFLFPIAVTVCISRVYIGVHYPLDVVVGAFYGLFCGGIALLIKERFVRDR